MVAGAPSVLAFPSLAYIVWNNNESYIEILH